MQAQAWETHQWKRKGNCKAESQKKSKACPHCGKHHPNHDSCWSLEKNADRRPNGWRPAKKLPGVSTGAKKQFSEKELYALADEIKARREKKSRKGKSTKSGAHKLKDNESDQDAYMAGFETKV